MSQHEQVTHRPVRRVYELSCQWRSPTLIQCTFPAAFTVTWTTLGGLTFSAICCTQHAYEVAAERRASGDTVIVTAGSPY